jgi:alkanesulfonate monooxygenase SsuD/methylene tetrahydromethanopterin reductase-like flavin-dependent oxidoreductase (luciferase family)
VVAVSLHDPADVVIGAGSAGLYVARNSQDAIDTYRPLFEASRALQIRLGLTPVFDTVEDFVTRSSALIGSPEQVLDKLHRYHERFGHTVQHVPADVGGLTAVQHRTSLDLFQDEVASLLRKEIPDPPWPPERDLVNAATRG